MKYTLTCADCSMVSMENANTSPTCRRLECCVCMYVCACCVCALLFWNLLMKQFAFLASYSTSLFSNVQISQDELIICTAWLIQKLACKFQNFSPCFFRPLSILPFMRSSTGLTRYQHQTHQPNRWLPVIVIQSIQSCRRANRKTQGKVYCTRYSIERGSALYKGII